MSIPFTQFLMPDGRQKAVTINRPPEVEAKAAALIAKGFTFEIEMLSTGEISMEIIKRAPDGSKEEDQSLAMEICHNGPAQGPRLGVPESVDKMISDACEELGL